MTLYGRPQLSPLPVDGVRTDETDQTVDLHSSCVSTRDPWPRDEVLAWFDATKRRLNLTSDYAASKYFGIGHTLISGWRNDRQRPSVDTLTRMAAVLEEDPRSLWVLAGQADAAGVGLTADAMEATRRAADRPQEFDDLLNAYFDPRMTDQDRTDVRRQVKLLALGILTDLEQREHGREARPTVRKRAG
jgi:transcriptional regulator with XRE-family HTH domain